jgi:hypothetical protein
MDGSAGQAPACAVSGANSPAIQQIELKIRPKPQRLNMLLSSPEQPLPVQPAFRIPAGL